MKPRNARLLDDLINKTNRQAIYRHVRDGHTSDLAEVVGALERRLPTDHATQSLLDYTRLLLEAHDVRGSDKARKRDKIRDAVLKQLKTEAALQQLKTENVAERRTKPH
jgi:gentisate 1,2-dioxygenase